jgi:hypothetical protein
VNDKDYISNNYPYQEFLAWVISLAEKETESERDTQTVFIKGNNEQV